MMGLCDICMAHQSVRQITFDDATVYFVCDDCTPIDPVVVRIEFIHDDRIELEAMWASS